MSLQKLLELIHNAEVDDSMHYKNRNDPTNRPIVWSKVKDKNYSPKWGDACRYGAKFFASLPDDDFDMLIDTYEDLFYDRGKEYIDDMSIEDFYEIIKNKSIRNRDNEYMECKYTRYAREFVYNGGSIEYLKNMPPMEYKKLAEG
jgi:hypothetical protein